MALVVADRVKESTTTTGTGTVNLAGAETGFQTFVAGIGNSNTTYYAIVDANTGDFEVGIGTVTDASPDTLSRDTILQSSNSDSAVNFGSGTKSVFCTQPADKAVFTNANGNIDFTGNLHFDDSTGTGDNRIKMGTGNDLQIFHNGTNAKINNASGALQIANSADDNDVTIATDDGSGGTTTYFRADGSNGEAVLYHYGTEKFATKSTGVDVTGNITVSGTVDGRDVAADGATADAALPKAGGTMTGNLTLSGTNTRINMPDDHYINRRFELDNADSYGVAYVLLCRNTSSNDVNGRITMDRTSGLRHACQVDIIVSSGSSSNPIGSLKAHGVTGSGGTSPSGPSYKLVTVTYSGLSYVALKITNPDDYYETSGAFFTGRIVNSGSNTLLATYSANVSNEAELTDGTARHTFQGDLDLLDNIVIAGTVDGRDIATDGTKLDGIESNATADQTASEILTAIKTVDGSGSGLDADTLDGIQGASFLRSDANDSTSGTLTVQTLSVGTNTVGTTSDIALSANVAINAENSLSFGMTDSTNGYYRWMFGNTSKTSGTGGGTEKMKLDKDGNLTLSGTVDGRDVAADGTKLDGIASSATANPNALDNLSEDSSPSLGGNLDLNSNDITGTGDINITGTLQTSSNAIIGGDLTVSGTTTTVNTETINLADNNIVLNSNLSSSTAPSENGGITINRGSATDKVFQWNESTDYWEIDDVLEIETATGWVQIGSKNTYHAHIYTDRPSYYFNRHIIVDQGIVRSYDEDLNLNRAGSSTARIRITDGTTHSDQAFDVTGNITVSGTVDGRDLATDGTKLDGIEASADVTDATNVAAAGALMDSEVTNLAQVKAFDSSDYATAAQGTTADAALPKAGGTMTGNLVLGDGIEARFGDGTDLVIKHVGGGSSSINNNSGTLQLNQFANDSDVVINSDNGSGSTANYFRADGSTGDAILYHYGTEKIKTQSGGVDVSGNITVSGTVDGRDVAADGSKLDGIETGATADQTKSDIDALGINADQVDGIEAASFLRSDAADTATGALTFGNSLTLNGSQTGNYPSLNLQSGSGSTSFINFGTSTDGDEGQIAYYPGSDYMQFKAGTSTAFQVNTLGIKLLDSARLQAGTSSDLIIYHNGVASYIDNDTSHLYIRNNVTDDDGGNIYIQPKSGEQSIIAYDDSGVALYHNNIQKVNVSSTYTYFYNHIYANSYDLYINDIFFNGHIDGSDDDRIKLGTGDDLQIYHDGSNSWIDNASSATPLRIDGYGMAITGSTGTVPFLEHTTSGMPTGHYGWVMHYTPYGNSSEVFRTVSNGVKITSNVELTGSVIFEGSSVDTNETTLSVTDPTADRTITLPDATGTVLTTGNADVGTTTTSSGDADHVLINDGGVLKKITPTNLGIGGFPSGTLMLFQQTAAPTGWTKQTTHNDKALRVVSGTAGTGGSSAFTTAFGTPSVSGSVGLSGDLAAGNLAVSMSGSISDTTLSTNQIPSHTHSLTPRRYDSDANNNTRGSSAPQGISGNTNIGTSGATGGGQAHNHAHNLSGTLTGTPGTGNLAGSLSSATATINVQYVDLIIAAKD